MSVFVVACGDDQDQQPVERVRPETEAEILEALQTDYKFQDNEHYAELLADDFRFYFDPVTREIEDLPEFWERATDSLQTARLLRSADLIGVKIKLTFGPTPQEVPGRPRWTNINVVDTFLEVELGPTDEYPDGVTLLVDGQINRFYFRKGRTEGDTLATSATAENLYIAEWRDSGDSLPFRSVTSKSEPLNRSTSWGSIKSRFSETLTSRSK
jgi:hypothetical protein